MQATAGRAKRRRRHDSDRGVTVWEEETGETATSDPAIGNARRSGVDARQPAAAATAAAAAIPAPRTLVPALHVLHVQRGIAFVNKPAGISTHPEPGRNRGRRCVCPACPVCGVRPGGQGVDVTLAWRWNALRQHLVAKSDDSHAAWRAAHPASIAAVDEFESEEQTLWHALRWAPTLFGTNNIAVNGTDPHPVLLPRVVHLCNRLDRQTSGVVVVAETAALARDVQAAWPLASKTYLAMCRGKCPASFVVAHALTAHSRAAQAAKRRRKRSRPEDADTDDRDGDGGSDKRLDDDANDNKVKVHDDDDGVSVGTVATTRFELVRTYFDGAFSLVRATLVHGGRTHQVRRHLARTAHQIVGDGKYGKSGINGWLRRDFGLPRMFLHAARVRMPHPDGVGAELDVACPLPGDLAGFLSRIPP